MTARLYTKEVVICMMALNIVNVILDFVRRRGLTSLLVDFGWFFVMYLLFTMAPRYREVAK
jgi:hypothetical protein